MQYFVLSTISANYLFIFLIEIFDVDFSFKIK